MLTEQVTDPIARHGECPMWAPAWGGLRWVDLAAGNVLALDASGTVRQRTVGRLAAAIRPYGDGGMVVARARDIALVASWDAEPVSLGELWRDDGVRFNDGGCDPDGNFWIGSMAVDHSGGRGAMYRLGPDGRAQRRFDGLGVSNGLDWTADGATAYYTDSLTGRVDRFDYDTERGLHARRPFVSVPEQLGIPDGLAVDADGHVWVALWNGGAVHRYTPDGRLDDVLRLPVRQVTACTFGGAGLDELYITTKPPGDGPPDHPAAGALFRARVGVRGQPVRPYGMRDVVSLAEGG